MPRTTRPTGRQRSRPYHHGDLRRALIDQALVTIRAEGVGALTLRQIAGDVGVSRTALYRHFTDKRALLSAVATEGFRTLRERLTAAWAKPGATYAGFAAQGTAYARFANESPSHYRVMFGGFVDPSDQDPELATEAAGAFQALVDLLAALQRGDAIRDGDITKMAVFVWSAVHGVAMLAIDGQLGPHTAVDEFTDFAIERIWNGIERRSGLPAPPSTDVGRRRGRRIAAKRDVVSES